MKALLEAINILFWIVVLVYPFLIPAVSSQSAIAAVIPQCLMILVFGTLIGLNLSIEFAKLTEKQRKRRKMLLHYFPSWMIPTGLLTLNGTIIAIEITLY